MLLSSPKQWPLSLKIAAIIMLCLWLLPELVRIAAVQLVNRQGTAELSIDDVDLNLFTGSVGIENLRLTQNGEPALEMQQLSLNINLLSSVLKQPSVASIVVAGSRIFLRERQGQWQWLQLPAAADSQADADTTADLLPAIELQLLRLSAVEVVLSGDSLQGVFSIPTLSLRQLSTVIEQPLTLQLNSSWNGAPLTLSMQGDVDTNRIQLSGSLTVENLALNSFASLIQKPLDGSLSSNINFTATHDLGGTTANISGDINAASLRSKLNVIDLLAEQLNWQGEVELNVNSNNISYQHTGDFSVAALAVNDSINKVKLLGSDNIELKGLKLDQNMAVSFASLELRKVAALQIDGDETSKLQNGMVKLGTTRFANNTLAISHMHITDAKYHSILTADGELVIDGLLKTINSTIAGEQQAQVDAQTTDSTASADETNPASTDQPTAEQQPFYFSIDEFLLDGDSQIQFSDQRFTAPLNYTLQIEKLKIQQLDSSDANQPFNLSLQASLNEFSTINIDATVKPFAEQIGLNAKGQLDGIDLRAFSPYTEALAGYSLTQGQLHHDFTINIAQELIYATNKVTLNKLRLQSADPKKAQPMERQINIPLDMSLNVLRDNDDNIELDVPIKGRLDEPGIGVNDVIGDALSNALLSGTTNYLKYMLQPYGAILIAAETVGKQMAKVELQAVTFSPANSELSAEQGDYIGKLVTLLAERDNIELSLCGYANSADQQALQKTEAATDERLLALAEVRSKAVKRALLDRGVDNKRLLLCQAQFKAEAIASVTLSM
jgi:outer membrane protein OmpA-like peptidoglycan-associated protein